MSSSTILRIALYATPPFFAAPHKIVLNTFAGCNYDLAYMHFRKGHANAWNLLWHTVCLFFQVFANFALLHAFDTYFDTMDGRMDVMGHDVPTNISFITLGMWAAVLMATPSPVVVKIGVLPILWLGYVSRAGLLDQWYFVLLLQGCLEALAISVYVLKRKTLKLAVRPIIVIQIGRYLLFRAMLRVGGYGSLSNVAGYVNLALAIIMIWVSLDPLPEHKLPGASKMLTPFTFGIFSWIFTILTAQPFLLFYGAGYLASLCQGCSHTYSGELPTLPGLQKISDEYAHVTYFPCLVLQSVYQSLMATKDPKEK